MAPRTKTTTTTTIPRTCSTPAKCAASLEGQGALSGALMAIYREAWATLSPATREVWRAEFSDYLVDLADACPGLLDGWAFVGNKAFFAKGRKAENQAHRRFRLKGDAS